MAAHVSGFASPVNNPGSSTKLQRQTWKELRDEVQSEGWESHWQEISLFSAPRKKKFIDTDNRNDGAAKNQEILNTTILKASNTLASGMVSGITSPSRPWFKLAVNNEVLKESGPVKVWLEQVTTILLEIMGKSNIYKVFHSTYKDLGLYGTAAQSIEFDPKDVIRAFPYPIGSYVVGLDDRLRASIFYHQVEYRVHQLVSKFGLENCSDAVKSMYKANNLNQKIEVIHGLEPNDLRNLNSALPTDMKVRSIWFEKSGKSDKFLRKSGFEELPVMVPRWVTNGTEPYGSSPGMEVLGVNKSIQVKEKRKNTVVDKLSDPPMVGPASLQQTGATLISGEITYIESNVNNGKFEPAHKVDPNAITAIREDIAEQKQEIRDAFFTDLFLLISDIERSGVTATEIIAKQQEKLLMLGPVLQNIDDDLLNPTVDRIFNIAFRNGLLPPIPQELQGQELKVEYISILHQAQRAVGINSIKDTVAFVISLAEVNPQVLDKVDFDQAVDEVADMNGTPATIIRSDDDVKLIREARDRQIALQQSAANIPEAANTVKTLSETPVGDQGETALDAVGQR